jgi:Flp pilus assembly protein TadD
VAYSHMCLQANFPDYLAAEALFKRALLLQPNNAIALAGLASIMENLHGDLDTAEELYVKALEVNRDDVSLLTHYALFVRDVRKDTNKARSFLLEALKRNPMNIWLKGNAHKF